MSKSKDRLWQEQRAEWYPQPVAAAVPHGDGNYPDKTQKAKSRATSPAAGLRGERRPLGLSRLLPLVIKAPVAFEAGVLSLDGIRAVQTTRGP